MTNHYIQMSSGEERAITEFQTFQLSSITLLKKRIKGARFIKPIHNELQYIKNAITFRAISLQITLKPQQSLRNQEGAKSRVHFDH